MQETSDSLKLIKLGDNLFTAQYSVVISNVFQVSVQKGSDKVPVTSLF